jgi:LPXTG-motif cell wall-anchored protein
VKPTTWNWRAAGPILGLATALTMIAPANAATATPTAQFVSSSACDVGGWIATFTMTTAGSGGTDAVFSNVVTDSLGSGYGNNDDTVPPPLPMTLFVDGGKVSSDGTFSEDWPMNHIVGEVRVTMTVTWTGGATTKVSTDVHAPTDCPYWPPRPSPTNTPTSVPTTTPTSTAAALADPADPADPAVPPTTNTPAGGGAGGGLPITGSATATVAGAAAVLMALGVGLYAATRRRKVKFTA